MDNYKEKFTKLGREIMKFLFANMGSYNQREISLALKVSPTAVANSIETLKKEQLINVKKPGNTKPVEITLNLQNNQVFQMKRVENLRAIYESGFIDYLSEKFPGATIILFGSYSFGEDNYSSDVDVAVVGTMRIAVELSGFEKKLNRKIVVQFFESFNKIHKNLRESILNGIVLKGSVRL